MLGFNSDLYLHKYLICFRKGQQSNETSSQTFPFTNSVVDAVADMTTVNTQFNSTGERWNQVSAPPQSQDNESLDHIPVSGWTMDGRRDTHSFGL